MTDFEANEMLRDTQEERLPFVGRETELGALREALNSAFRGHGSVVLVSGEVGTGKSSLVMALLTEVRDSGAQVRTGTGECRRLTGPEGENHGASDPYLPFLEALAEIKGWPQTPSLREPDLLHRLLRVGESVGLSAVDLAVPFLGSAIGVGKTVYEEFLGGRRRGERIERNRVIQTYVSQVLEASTECPVLLFIDDLHWADHASVELLNHLAGAITDQRVLVVGSFRPSDARHYAQRQNHPLLQALTVMERYGTAQPVKLERLTDEMVGAYLGERYTPNDFPAAFVRRVAALTGGNPLFMTEVCTLLEQRAVVAAGPQGNYTLSQAWDEIDLPDKIEAVMDERMAMLTPEMLHMLERASIEGERFHVVVLADLVGDGHAGWSEDELHGQLRAAEHVYRLVAADGGRTS